MHAYGYFALSAADESEERKVADLTRFCNEKRIELEMVFVDSYDALDIPFPERPAASHLLKVAKVRPVTYLVVYELAEVGRTPLDTLNVVLNLIEKPREKDGLGLQILSVNEEFMNLTDPSEREKLLRVIDWFRHHERKKIRERQLAAWKEGKQKGRPRQLDPEELKEYFRMYPGLSVSAITRIINEERERMGKKKVGYTTIRMLAKRIGVKWRLMIPEEPIIQDWEDKDGKN